MFQAREHQNLALQFIKERESQGPLKGGILALKMGLGKTATIMKLVLDENDDDETLGLEKLSIGDKTYSNTATLVACSKTVLGEWINEKEKFFPNLRMLVYHRDFYKDFKNLSWEDLSEYDLVVTTYDVISTADRKKNFSSSICIKGEDGIHKDKIIGFRQIQSPAERNERDPYGPHILFTYPWKRFVTDESQRFSNSKTKLFRAICSIYSEYRWCLTGTPIRNADSDMWSLLFFCGLTEPDNPKNYKYEHFYDVKNIMLVMGYQEAKIELPKLISHDIKIDFNAEEYEIYKFYLQELWDAYDRFIRQTGEFAGEDGFALILGLFCRLRQICISTYLVTDESKRGRETAPTALADNINLENYVHDKIMAGFYASKILKIKEIVDNIPKGEKVVIFSSFGACLDLIYDFLKTDYRMIYIDGSITGKTRQDRLNNFRQKKRYKILLCNLKIGGEGINLTDANHVICVELWWNSSIVNQAISRCWRVGQKREVHSYKIIVNGSIEEGIAEICRAKESISNSYLYGETKRIPKPKLDSATLGKIIGYYQ